MTCDEPPFGQSAAQPENVNAGNVGAQIGLGAQGIAMATSTVRGLDSAACLARGHVLPQPFGRGIRAVWPVSAVVGRREDYLTV